MTKEQPRLTPDHIATICDTIATIENPEERAARIAQAAEKYDVPEEAIQATFAHVKIRRDRALDAVREVINKKKMTIGLADEGREYLGKKKIPGGRKIATHLKERNVELVLLQEGLALLRSATTEQDVLTAIAKFAEAGDDQILEVIAEVYSTKRPDIAIEALLRGGSPDAALALAVQHQRVGHRKTFQQLLGRVGEELA